MDEISNKTLATLLVVAIVISLAGTFFAMRGVSQVTNYISGAQTSSDTGTAKVNISELTTITLVTPEVDFGTGYRNATDVDLNTECNITTNQSSPQDADTATNADANCWINVTTFAPDPFLLRNDGSNYVNVTINSSTPADFLPGSPTGGTEQYMFVPSDASSGVYVSSENGCNTTAFSITALTTFTGTEQLLCTNMSPFDGEDEFTVDILVGVPAGILGEAEEDVYFYAEKSDQ